MEKYVVVDWRPDELPQVYGWFDNQELAEDWAKEQFCDFGTQDNPLPDGITITVLQQSM